MLSVLSGNRVMDGTGSFNTVFDPVKVLPYLVIPDPALPPFVIDPVGSMQSRCRPQRVAVVLVSLVKARRSVKGCSPRHSHAPR